MEWLANASSKNGRLAPSTNNEKDWGVVIPLVTAERERESFFCRDDPFFMCIASLFFLSGASGKFYIFLIIILNLIKSFYFLFPTRAKDIERKLCQIRQLNSIPRDFSLCYKLNYYNQKTRQTFRATNGTTGQLFWPF